MLKQKANELGVALSETAEFKRLQCAKAEIEKDADVSRLLREYIKKQDEMMQVMAGDGEACASEQDFSLEIGEIQSQLLRSSLFIEMVSAQMAFKDLMLQVSALVEAHVGPTDAAEASEISSCTQWLH